MMLMGRRRLSRRVMLRGAGSVAIALPWLEAMDHEGVAKAAEASAAKRFVSVYTPGGTVADKFWPTGAEDEPVLSPILKPLAPVLPKLLVLNGLNMACAVGEQHQAGIIGFLTGSKQTGSPNNYSSFPSIDQVIAAQISTGIKSRGSIQMAIRWATGKSHGLLHPINAVNFENAAMPSPIPPWLDPVTIYKDLFGGLEADVPTATKELARKKSVLDLVDKQYQRLSAKLGAADRAKVEQHLTKIREIETSLDKVVEEGTHCSAPAMVDTSRYNPKTGLNSGEAGEVKDQATDAMIPTVGKLMMDMLVMALACDITAVASLQWSDTEAKHTFPWLGLSEHHHFYQHDGGFRPAECQQIYTWYAEQHSYLLQQMEAVDMGGGKTLLDESVVFFGSELAHPPTHAKTNMPFLLAGGGGALRGGRHLNFGGRSHNDLLLTILSLFGDHRETYGAPEFCTGVLSGLT
jgi:hypothetical protein